MQTKDRRGGKGRRKTEDSEKLERQKTRRSQKDRRGREGRRKVDEVGEKWKIEMAEKYQESGLGAEYKKDLKGR